MREKRIYLREWRKHRQLTQRQVVDYLASLEDPMLPTTEASLSRIETGAQIYSERILEALADKYDCQPWELLGRHPGKEGRVLDMLSRMGDKDRVKAADLLEAAFRDTGTDNK